MPTHSDKKSKTKKTQKNNHKHFKKNTEFQDWQKCEGHLLKTTEIHFNTIRPSTEDMERERLEKDVRSTFKYFKKDEDRTWWENFFKEGKK